MIDFPTSGPSNLQYITMNLKVFHNYRKSPRRCFLDPKMTPKWSQNGSQMPPNCLPGALRKPSESLWELSGSFRLLSGVHLESSDIDFGTPRTNFGAPRTILGPLGADFGAPGADLELPEQILEPPELILSPRNLVCS